MATPSTAYKFRAECRHDVDELLKVFTPDSITIRQDTSELPDVDVDLTSSKSLVEIRALMEPIVDSHVMIESLNTSAEYTGERWYSGEGDEDEPDLRRFGGYYPDDGSEPSDADIKRAEASTMAGRMIASLRDRDEEITKIKREWRDRVEESKEVSRIYLCAMRGCDHEVPPGAMCCKKHGGSDPKNPLSDEERKEAIGRRTYSCTECGNSEFDSTDGLVFYTKKKCCKCHGKKDVTVPVASSSSAAITAMEGHLRGNVQGKHISMVKNLVIPKRFRPVQIQQFSDELPEGVECYYVKNFFSNADADRLFTELKQDYPFRQEQSRAYGLHDQPRLTRFMGTEGKSYYYSGYRREAVGWVASAKEIRDRINAGEDQIVNQDLDSLAG